MKRIYLDHNATTPVRKEVRNAVLPFLENMFGNPSSRHREGRVVRTAVERSREAIAEVLNCEPKRVVFISSATEGNNAVLKGYWTNYKEKMAKNHIIITAVEHPSVYNTAKLLEKKGFEITILPVNSKGKLNPENIKDAIKENTGLISVMLANNETGNIYPVKEIAAIAKKHNIQSSHSFHCVEFMAGES